MTDENLITILHHYLLSFIFYLLSLNLYPIIHFRNQDFTMPLCKFKTVTGIICSEEAGEASYCYWHDDNKIKQETDLKQKLEKRAQTDEPMRYFKLKRTDLSDINLVNKGSYKGYELSHSDLYRANLSKSHLFAIDLSFSSLMKADLTDANLHSANLEHTNLLGVKLNGTKLEGVQWGEMVRQEWQANHEEDPKRQLQLYSEAEEIYRSIAREMRNQGMTSEITWFTYREMVTLRKKHPKFSVQRFISKFIDLYCGYGEKPMRLVLVSSILVIGFAFLYTINGVVQNNEIIHLNNNMSLIENMHVLLSSLYFSTVTFTTLGYGDISPFGLTRFIAAMEAFAGSFTMALFVLVFVKRMTR